MANSLTAFAITLAMALAGQAPRPETMLSGRVLHKELPVPGATVTATRGQRWIATTSDENGAFGLLDLEAGTWTIAVDMRGFTTVTRDVTIPLATPPLDITLTMRPYAEIVTPGAVQPADAAAIAVATDRAEILTGSVVNGAATPFAQPRAIGNNRPRPNSLYTGAVSATLGHSAWDARPYSFGGSTSPRPSYANAQLNVSFGGPLRIPFLLPYGPLTQLTYQRGVRHTANTQSALVPTLAERRGDLSARPGIIRDPQTGRPFVDNVIPPNRIVPQASALLAHYPQPTGATPTGANFQQPLLSAATTDSVQVVVSHDVSVRTVLVGTVGYERSIADSANVFDFTDRARERTITAGLTWRRRFSTRLNVRASYQFTSFESTMTPFFAHRVNVSGDAGIAGNDQDPHNWGPPTVVFPDIVDLRDAYHQQRGRTSHVLGGEAQLRRGRHNLTFGADARLHFLDLLTQTDPRGTLTFTGAATGDALADFLLGIPSTSAIAAGRGGARIRGGSHDAYIGDDFRVGAGITADLGVRWEYETPYTERDGHLANLDVAPGFAVVAPVVASHPDGALTGVRYPRSLVRADRRGFQPRVGLSWRPNLASSLVFRGGYGLYRNLGVYQSIGTLLAQQPPFATTFSVQNSAATPLSLANPFPASLPSQATFAVDPDYRPAHLHSWQLTVQRDLPASLTVISAYFGDRGTRLTQAFLPNTFPPGAVSPCPACPSGFVYLTSGGTSTRNAAQLTLRRRLDAGLAASVVYTLAKSTDDAATFSNSTVAPGTMSVAQNWLDLDAEWGPSPFDQRHLVAVDVQYTTGVGVLGGTLFDGFWGRLYRDWTITAQFTAGSGMPLTPVFFAAVPGTAQVGVRPSLSGAPIADASDGAYANALAFTAPAPGSWGDAGRNSMRGPSTSNFDLAVARAFRLGGRRTVEWRIAATNVLNRVVFSSIDRIVTSPQFGRPTATSPMRRIQTMLRFAF